MSDEQEANAPEPVTDEIEAPTGFDELFEGGTIKPEEISDESPDVEEETPSTDEAETVEDTGDSVEEKESGEPKQTEEGEKSLSMQLLARQNGIPEELIKLSRDDVQLKEFIDLAATAHQQHYQETTAEPVEEFKIELSEDEYGAEDPLRRELTRLHTHHEKQTKQIKEFLSEVTGVVRNLQDQAQGSQQQQAMEFQMEFDRGLDELQHDLFGQSGKGELPTNNVDIRSTVFNRVNQMRQNGAVGSGYELGMQAAKAMFPTLLNGSNQQEPERKTRRKPQLGNGASQSVEPTPSREDKLFAKWDKVFANNRE